MGKAHLLLDAAAEGNFDKVTRYLQLGVPVDTKEDRFGRAVSTISSCSTLLHDIVYTYNLALIKVPGLAVDGIL